MCLKKDISNMFNYIIAVDVLYMVEWQPCTWKVGSLHASLIITCSAKEVKVIWVFLPING